MYDCNYENLGLNTDCPFYLVLIQQLSWDVHRTGILQ